MKVYLLSKDEGGMNRPFVNNFQSQMFCKTWDAPVMMQLPAGKDLIMPGEDSAITMTVRKHIVSNLYFSFCFSTIAAVTDYQNIPYTSYFFGT